MARLPKTKSVKGEPELKPSDKVGDDPRAARVSLAEALSTKTRYAVFSSWVVGLKPLIVHSWSQKTKTEMLQGQVKAVRGAGRAPRKPHEDFVNSIYRMGRDKKGREMYGFPSTGIKKSLLSAAHQDKGLAKTVALSSLWLDASMVPVQTAVKGAICDLPLVRIWGDEPQMREDMVRVGVGLSKKASLAYRGQFTRWAIRIRGRYNMATMNAEKLAFLVNEAGLATGVGEWRNEKGGVFGSYRLASLEEERAWDAYAAGKGPIPEIIGESDFEDEFAVAAE